MARVQLCSTARMPRRAPRKRGSAANFCKASARGLHQYAVNHLRVGLGQRPQSSGKRERDQVIGAREQSLTLLSEPSLGLIVVTLRTTAVATGVIAIPLLRALVALIDVASKERRTAVFDIAKRFFLNRRQLRSELRPKLSAVEADNLGHLQHEDLGSEVSHQLIQRLHDPIANLGG